MLLNFNGLLKSASLFLLTLMLSGCISFALVSNAGKRTSGTYKYQSDTITGLSLAKDSNGTKGYVFVGESLDYLITDGGDDWICPYISRHLLSLNPLLACCR
ncbi:hypothetical protein ABL945_18805, partial [Escherichia albertii]